MVNETLHAAQRGLVIRGWADGRRPYPDSEPAVLTVGILDDDPLAVRTISLSMKLAGMFVRPYQSCTEFLQALDGDAATCDAYVIDWQLRSCTSTTVVGRIRANARTARAPIFLLTGHDQNQELARAISDFRLEYRRKPYSLHSLASEIAVQSALAHAGDDPQAA